MADDSSVTCRLVLGGEIASFSAAVAYFRLERADAADAPAELIAEKVLRGVSHSLGSEARIDVVLSGPRPVSDRGHYYVRAHLDLDGDGRVSRGDYVTVESHPVLTFGHPAEVSLRVREVQ
jgi:hypothetical protein